MMWRKSDEKSRLQEISNSCCRWAFSNSLQLCRKWLCYVTNMLQYDGQLYEIVTDCYNITIILIIFIAVMILYWFCFISMVLLQLALAGWPDLRSHLQKALAKPEAEPPLGNGINSPLPLCSSSRTALRFDRMVYPSYAGDAIQNKQQEKWSNCSACRFSPPNWRNSGKAWCHRNMSQNFLDTCHHLSIVQGVQGHSKASWQTACGEQASEYCLA